MNLWLLSYSITAAATCQSDDDGDTIDDDTNDDDENDDDENLSYSITAAVTCQSDDDGDSNREINDYDGKSLVLDYSYKSDDEDGNLLG